MIYTLQNMRDYARSLDARLTNLTKFPDAYIDQRIQDGIAIAQSTKPVFITTEVYDLTSNITVDLLTEVEIILQREVHSVMSVTLDTRVFTYEVTANNHILVKLLANHDTITDYTVTVKYYFYPTLPIVQLEMSQEIWALVKEGIAINSFAWLSDEVNENKHRGLIKELMVTATFATDETVLDTPVDRFWSRSWA